MASRPWIIAHRGAVSHAPENTLPAIALAAELGADRAEIDVQLTADGVPVLLHDATVDRTTDGTGWLAGLSWREVRRLDASQPRRWGGRFRGCQVPSLEEALAVATAAGLRLCVELKSSRVDPVLVDRVLTLLAEAGLLAETWLWSFPTANLELVRQQTWDPALGSLTLGLPGRRERAVSDMLVPLAAHLALADPNLLHRQGQPVVVWTTNQPALVERFADRGAFGLITNVPGLVRPLFAGEPRPLS